MTFGCERIGAAALAAAVMAPWPGAHAVLDVHRAVTRESPRLTEAFQPSQVASDPDFLAALRNFELGGRFNRAMQLLEANEWDEPARLSVAHPVTAGPRADALANPETT